MTADPHIAEARKRADLANATEFSRWEVVKHHDGGKALAEIDATPEVRALADDVLALAARLEAAERDLADARKAMEFLANETLFGSIVAEYAQKKIAAAQQPPAEESDG